MVQIHHKRDMVQIHHRDIQVWYQVWDQVWYQVAILNICDRDIQALNQVALNQVTVLEGVADLADLVEEE